MPCGDALLVKLHSTDNATPQGVGRWIVSLSSISAQAK